MPGEPVFKEIKVGVDELTYYQLRQMHIADEMSRGLATQARIIIEDYFNSQDPSYNPTAPNPKPGEAGHVLADGHVVTQEELDRVARAEEYLRRQ